MNVETVLRRMEKECRETIKAFDGYEPRWRGNKGAIMKGAVAEARGIVDACTELRGLSRRMRAEHRISND